MTAKKRAPAGVDVMRLRALVDEHQRPEPGGLTSAQVAGLAARREAIRAELQRLLGARGPAQALKLARQLIKQRGAYAHLRDIAPVRRVAVRDDPRSASSVRSVVSNNVERGKRS